jgi:hypothetical protein
MRTLPLLLLALLAALVIPIALRLSRPARAHEFIEAQDAAMGIPSQAVHLPEADDERPERPRRTGETQELKRKVVHGPYRPIKDRGVQSGVRTESLR